MFRDDFFSLIALWRWFAYRQTLFTATFTRDWTVSNYLYSSYITGKYRAWNLLSSLVDVNEIVLGTNALTFWMTIFPICVTVFSIPSLLLWTSSEFLFNNLFSSLACYNNSFRFLNRCLYNFGCERDKESKPCSYKLQSSLYEHG